MSAMGGVYYTLAQHQKRRILSHRKTCLDKLSKEMITNIKVMKRLKLEVLCRHPQHLLKALQ